MEPVALPRLSLAERDRRYVAVRAAMAEIGLDCIVAPQNTGEWDACQPDVRYLTTIGGGGTAAAAVFPARGEPTAIVREPRRVDFWRAAQGWVADIRATREGSWGEAMASALSDHCGGRARVGIAGLEGVLRFPDGTVSSGELHALRQAFPEAAFVDATGLMHDIRQVKSAEEIALIERAQACADTIGAAVFQYARAGVSEHALYAEMMAAHIRSGGEVPAMLLVGIGKAPSQTFLMPTFRALEQGDILICESEIKHAGYMAQSIEAVSLGPPGADYARMFEASLDCFEMLLEAFRPGVPYAELIRLWGAHMEAAGLRAAPTMGHGLGLGQDGPTTRPGGDARGRTVEVGHCFILKPWATSADGARAIRAGNTIVVEENGARRLGRLAMEFRVV
ncbi:MAG: M24 family metallopeptidase [Defluviicoccus sp.]|nr:M24 family metallopeptidase [Defluviicoccus sp.]